MLTLDGHQGKVRCLAFSPDGTRLASVAGREKHVSLWGLPGGERAVPPEGYDVVGSLAFAPDGGGVAFTVGRAVHLWEVGAGVVRWFRKVAASQCHALAYSPDGAMLAGACYGGGDRYRVDLFRTAGDVKKSWLVGGYGAPHCLAFSPDGRVLAAGGEDKCVRIWGIAEKARAVTWKCGAPVYSVAYSPDGVLAAVAAGCDVTLFGRGTNKPCGVLAGHVGVVRVVAFAPDGRTLLSAGDDGVARLWDVAVGRERAAFDWKIGAVGVAAFSPDGMLAAAGGEDGGLVVWDVE